MTHEDALAIISALGHISDSISLGVAVFSGLSVFMAGFMHSILGSRK